MAVYRVQCPKCGHLIAEAPDAALLAVAAMCPNPACSAPEAHVREGIRHDMFDTRPQSFMLP